MASQRACRFSVGDRVRFALGVVLVVHDTEGTVERVWPDGGIRVLWDSGPRSYVEMAQQGQIEQVPDA